MSAATRLHMATISQTTLRTSKRLSRPLMLLAYPISRTNACHPNWSMPPRLKAWKSSLPRQYSHLGDQATIRTWSTSIRPSAARTCQKHQVVVVSQLPATSKALSLAQNLVLRVLQVLQARLEVVASRRVTADKRVCTSSDPFCFEQFCESHWRTGEPL